MQEDPLNPRIAPPEERVISYRPERPGIEFQRVEGVVVAPVVARSVVQPVNSAPYMTAGPMEAAGGAMAQAPVYASPEVVQGIEQVPVVAATPTIAAQSRKSFTLWQAALVFIAIIGLGFAAFLAYNALIAQ